MADIFISYAQEDRSRVSPLIKALADYGWSIWWDRTIPAGKTWREVIGEALENARSVVVVWSKESVKSRWVQEEADWGLERKILIPILFDEIRPPLGFGAIQAINLANWNPTQSSSDFEKLIADISTILGPPPRHVEKGEEEADDVKKTKSDKISKAPALVSPNTEPVQEKRRIDAVAPSNARLGQSMDVFLQVRFPESEYLSIKDWPLKVRPPSIAQASKLTNVKYSRSNQGNLNPACLRIIVVAPEFKIEGEAEKKIEIVPKEFSDLISFQLTPKSLGEQRIMVKVYDENGISVGELPVETNVNDTKKPLVNEAAIVVLDLNVLILVEPAVAREGMERRADFEEINYMPTAEPFEKEIELRELPRKRSASKLGILSALTLLIAAGSTWMFVQQKTVSRPTDSGTVVVPQPPVAAKPADQSPPKRFTNSIGMEFILIPSGSFTMGSNLGRESEKPPHHVKISQSFYLQTTEVSQGQWKKVMGNNPSSFKECGDDCPVEQVSWDDVNKFVKKLNVMERTDRYRLPSEAEWEYACRAGKITEFSFGDDASNLAEYAWYDGNSEEATHKAGAKKPNPWGLYDMHGNVWEWVEDDWHDWYDGSPAGDQAWVDKPRDSRRVIRGCSWESVDFDCRSATRFGEQNANRSFSLGFRVAKSVALGQ